MSDRSGLYRFPGVPPGLYTIHGTLPGFDPAAETVRVALDATSTLNLALRLAVHETVSVSGETPLVDVTSTVGPVTAMLQAYVFNLFNNQIRTSRDDIWSNSPPPDYPASLFDPNQERNNPEHGKATSRQDPRLVRASVKISF